MRDYHLGIVNARMVDELLDMLELYNKRTHQNTQFIIHFDVIKLEKETLLVVDSSHTSRFKVRKTLAYPFNRMRRTAASFCDLVDA